MKSIALFLLKFINVKELLKELVDVKLEAEIDRIVEKTDNHWDDITKATIYPVLEAEMLLKIEEMDIVKLLKLDEA